MKRNHRKANLKRWRDRRSKKIARNKKRSKKYNSLREKIYNRQIYLKKADPIIAPSNICVFEGSNKSLFFFSEMRKNKNITKSPTLHFVQIDISKVQEFDYSSICILMAIIQDLKSKKILVRGNFPEDQECKRRIIESGLLNFMTDNNGNPFKKAEKSDLLFIEKGYGKLKEEDNKNISLTLLKISKHLTRKENSLPKLRRILLEICGNSIEWGGTKNKQWLFGVLYENNSVQITITDVGEGILETLNKKFQQKLIDFFTSKSSVEILKGAFKKKYGSSTGEINRNKGLPSIKDSYDRGVIQELRVLTNDVILDFENDGLTRVLEKCKFNGTLYRWKVTEESINK